MKKILSNKLWVSVLIADMISNFGDILFYLALMNYVLLLPDAKYAIALITLSESIPQILSVVTGYLADRSTNKVPKIIMTQLFRVVMYIIVGLLLGFSPALWIALIIIVINLLSDLSASYENGLYVPISVQIISNDLREQAMGFRQTVTQISKIVFESISALLVVMLSYRQLAFLNAGTFLISAIIMISISKSLNKLLPKDEKNIVEKKEKMSFIKSFKNSGKEAFHALKEDRELLVGLTWAPLINALFVVIIPLMLLLINEYNHFVIVNAPTTIAFNSILMTIFSILGSILSMTIFRKYTISQLLIAILLIGCTTMVGMYLVNIYVFFGTVALLSMCASALQPKINSRIMNNLPKENLALIMGFIGTYATSGMLVMNLIFSILVVVFSVQVIVLIYMITIIISTIGLIKILKNS